MRIEVEQEEDGRWLTEIPDLPGVLAYGVSREESVARVKALALRVLADRDGKNIHSRRVPREDGGNQRVGGTPKGWTVGPERTQRPIL